MKLSLNIAKQLEAKILNQEFLADQPLPSEARLCESFGVSRTVIREAIQQLKSQGIVHSITGSGHYVSRSNTDDLKRNLSLLARLNEGTQLYDEILQLRELLELHCLELVCQKHDTNLPQKLQTHLDHMREHQQDFDTFAKHDHAFHLEILKASNNQLFCAILESLYENFLQISRKVYEKPGAIECVLSEHSSILQAIQNQDAPSGLHTLKNHIQKSKDGL